MRKFIFSLVTVFCTVLAAQTAAEEERALTSAELADVFANYGVICLDARPDHTCAGINIVASFNEHFGTETQISALDSLSNGAYPTITTQPNFTFEDDRLCYPNMRSDLFAARIFLVSDLMMPPAASTFADEHVIWSVRNAFVSPTTKMIGLGTYCVQYIAKSMCTKEDKVVMRAYVDGKPIEGDTPVLFYTHKEVQQRLLRLRAQNAPVDPEHMITTKPCDLTVVDYSAATDAG